MEGTGETDWLAEGRGFEPSVPLAGLSLDFSGRRKAVEADETYIGGKARNKAYGPPPKKMAVFTLVEREGKARSRHVPDVTAKTLREAIVARADRKSYLMTDEALVYERIGREFSGHGTVRHSADEYSRTGGFHHTNTVESFFALLKARDLWQLPPRQRGPSASLPRRVRFSVQSTRHFGCRARRRSATRRQGQATTLPTA
jgi:hypothetical protein